MEQKTNCHMVTGFLLYLTPRGAKERIYKINTFI